MAVTSLTAVWLSADKIAAADMMFLFLRDCKLQRRFEEATLILWGPSVLEAVENDYIKTQLEILLSVGVAVRACKACASLYGVVEELAALNIPPEPLSEHISELIKANQGLIFI